MFKYEICDVKKRVKTAVKHSGDFRTSIDLKKAKLCMLKNIFQKDLKLFNSGQFLLDRDPNLDVIYAEALEVLPGDTAVDAAHRGLQVDLHTANCLPAHLHKNTRRIRVCFQTNPIRE